MPRALCRENYCPYWRDWFTFEEGEPPLCPCCKMPGKVAEPGKTVWQILMEDDDPHPPSQNTDFDARK